MKPNNQKWILLALILVLPVSAFSQDLSGIAGAYADIGLGTRPLGMGGAYTAVAEDDNAARWNPAALSLASTRSAGFTWTNQFNLIPYNYLAGSYPLQQWGAGFFVESAGDDVYRENTIAFAGGTSFEKLNMLPMLKGLHVGASAKIRWVGFGNNEDGGEGQISGDAFGFGLDIGFLYQTPFTDKVQLAFVTRDLLNTISWSTDGPNGSYSEGVPVSMVFGAAYHPYDNTLLTIDLSPAVYKDAYTRVAMGGEYMMFNIVALRAGIAQNLSSPFQNRDVTFGLGINYKFKDIGTIRAGVSYLIDELVNTPRVGLSFVW
ncbi:hypothetical protein K8I28_05650 [bacterium]|nr:hypothetical protein [bacterium]